MNTPTASPHTPTLWTAYGLNDGNACHIGSLAPDKRLGDYIATGHTIALTQQIIHEHNSHAALVAAAQARVDEWHANAHNFNRREPESLKLARAALAGAKE